MTHTFVVTGANRGIGLEICRQLGSRGDRVIATARVPESASELQKLGIRIERLDVDDQESVDEFARALAGESIDVLVNNAGRGGHGQPIGLVDGDDMVEFFRTNSVGPLRVTQSLLPNLEAGHRKLIVSISSKMGSIGDNGSGGAFAYRTSKTALNMINKSMAIDLAPRGLICVVLHPGWVKTDMGGPGAPLSVEQSVSGIIAVIDGLAVRDTGCFFDFEGNPVPW